MRAAGQACGLDWPARVSVAVARRFEGLRADNSASKRASEKEGEG